MRVLKGNSRVVILLPGLQVALKFPRICAQIALSNMECAVRSRKWRKIKMVLTRNPRTHLGVLGPLFRGVVVNWSEYKFYTKTRHVLLQPTYFSLFGLINIQQAAKPCSLDKERLWECLFAVVGDPLNEDYHHFSNPDNFTDDFRIVDYGWEKTQQIVVDFGEKMAMQLLVASCYAEKGVKI